MQNPGLLLAAPGILEKLARLPLALSDAATTAAFGKTT